MDDKELNELLEYNLEYMDARLSEDVFGGDYTSEVELKHLEKAYDKLHSNWNSLKAVIMLYIEETKKSLEFCKIHHLRDDNYKRDLNLFQMILDKMNQLERNNKL